MEGSAMFKKILVPVDLTKKNKKALDIAVKIALHDTGKIFLLHVIETIENTAFSEFETFYRELEKKAAHHMDSMIAPYKKNKVPIEQDISFGHRVQEILKFSEKKKMDLIVMHSHKVNLKDPVTGWGTISYKVGLLSQRPVMLVK
jgi:nucleotide-binding universal stress UspA family protein